MRVKTWVAITLFVTGILFSLPVLAQPLADYGDAPDPMFPSLFASGGPYHLNLTDCWVGWMSTPEPDALIPDMDVDDGAPMLTATYTNGQWMGWIYVPITIDPEAPPNNVQPRYLNVALDCFSSGQWSDNPGEWIVRNYRLPHSWFVHFPGQTVWYCIGGFTWVNDYSGIHWLRVMLSESPIAANVPNGWDGSWGTGFQMGETEDWPLQWYYHPPQPPNPPGMMPPYDMANPPFPQPNPPCSKVGAVSQTPPPVHRGHSGNFGLVVENTSNNHPVHIVEGPVATDVNGDPIDIGLESLESKILQPGESDTVGGTWTFGEPGPNQAACNWDVVTGPVPTNAAEGSALQLTPGYVVIVNVGDYDSPTGTQPTGGTFEETSPIPTLNTVGIIALIVVLVSISVFLFVRRRKSATS